MSKPKIILLCGIAGSGKSTYAAKLVQANPNTEIVSSDSIREKVFGDINDQTHNYEIFSKIIPHEIRCGIGWEKDVIVDATNISIKDRSSYIKLARELNVDIECHYIPVDLDNARIQNEGRERKVPDFVLVKHAQKFVVPTVKEGFSNVYNIRKEEAISYGLERLAEELDKRGLYFPNEQ